jgi:hypothetical protein
MVIRKILAIGALLLSVLDAGSTQAETIAPPSPTAFFVGIKDGDVVHNPVKVGFGVSGMTIAPAGTTAPQTGHFHLLLDAAMTPEQMKFAIPSDAQHLHYGKGQTEAVITLPPGTHKLQILLGDGKHVPHQPPVLSAPITVTVQ